MLFIKFKIKCLPVSWLSIPFSDADLMLQFCLPYIGSQNGEEGAGFAGLVEPYMERQHVCMIKLIFGNLDGFYLFLCVYNQVCCSGRIF